jgi:dTDP-4-dehydrorhamnose reductase
MKIVLTGSSGLLGSDIALEALKQKQALIGLCRHPSKPFEIEADITKDGIAKIANLDFNCLIHTAAWRNPDECESDRDGTYLINVEAVKALAEIARKKNSLFVYISTDYVFSGENPPYSEESAPCPVNYYGETKLLGEKAVLQKIPNAVILRVPLLYGVNAGLAKSAALMTSLRALDSGKKWDMEDSIVRFPTYTGDAAKAVFFLIRKNAAGIYHFSGQDQTTRYKMTVEMAEIFEKKIVSIVRLDEPPPAEAKRPRNSQLSMNKILKMGLPPPIHFGKRLRLLKNEILRQYDDIKKNSKN